VTGDAVERWAEAVAAEHGFSQVRHTLEIDGVCAECAGR
jgi:Fur family ferric uptake transcriptional regulator